MAAMVQAAFEKSLHNCSCSSLEDSKAMAFLNRFDIKFVLNVENVLDFLKAIKDDYSVLQINDNFIQSYETVYFDTPDLLCFNLHHNKRACRFKVRTRKYLSNGKIFNEIKRKLNTGKTIKFRQRRDVEKNGVPVLEKFSEFDGHFKNLATCNGYDFGHLTPSLNVFFNRITFLNKNFPERMTLDFGLKYAFNKNEFTLPQTSIVELKREKSPEKTAAQEFFRSIHKNPAGFSKYCIGIALTHDEAKKNRFMPKLRKLYFNRSSL